MGPQGQYEKTWQHGAVVFAKVTGFEKSGPGGTFKLTLFATLSGNLDSAYQREISAGALIGNWDGTDIEKAPRVGASVIAFVDRDINGNYLIPNGDANFFPKADDKSRPCIFDVSGFDDPKVTETIENLRKLRGKQREEAEQKAAAEKKSSPEKQPAK